MGNGVDTAIVGGGFAGLALACRLAEAGRTARVVERATETPRPPRAFFLQPNGLAALERLGALPQVLERGARQERVTYYSAGGRRLFAYEFGELRHPHAYLVTIRVDLLQETLAERLAELGGEPPVTGADFAGVVRTNGAVTGVRYRDAGGERDLPARCTVGADGAGSRVRAELGIDADEPRFTLTEPYVIGIGGDPADLPSAEAAVYWGRGYGNGVVRIPGGRTYFWDHVTPDLRDAIERRDLDGWLDVYRRRLPLAGAVADGIRSWDDVMVLTPRPFSTRRRAVPGAALIGDAAGTVHPQLGQGVNLALEDAVALGEMLAAVPDGGGPVPLEALEAYARPRARRQRVMLARSLFIAYSQDVDNVAWRTIRALGAASSRVRPVRNALMARGAGVGRF